MTAATERLQLALPPFLGGASELTPFRLGIVMVLVSIAYALLRLAFDPLMNPDAVYYLVAAEAWMDAGLDSALEIYWRPFYSILIGSVATVSGLSPLVSAHVVNMALAAALLIGVQLLVVELGGGVRAQAMAMGLLLLWPSLNEFRTLVLRDFGYWAGSVLGRVALIRYARHGGVVAAGLFYIAVLVAMLFRPEAVVLIVLPLVLVAGRPDGRLRAVLVSLVPLLFAASMLALGAAISERIAQFVEGLLNESLRVPLGLIDSVPDRFAAMQQAFAGRVLNLEFNDYATVGLIVGVIAIVLAHFVAALTWPVLLVSALGLRRATFAALEPDAVRLALSLVVLVVVVLCVFLVIRPIMQTRFLILPALMFVALFPFAVTYLHDRAAATGRMRTYRWGAGLVIVYLVAEAGFSLTQSKDYIIDGIALIEEKTTADARVYSNDARISYLSGRPYSWGDMLDASVLHRFPARRQAELAREYDYWALHLRRRKAGRDALEAVTAGWREIGRTGNGKGDEVILLATPRDPPIGAPSGAKTHE